MESHEYKLLQERLEKKSRTIPIVVPATLKAKKVMKRGFLQPKSILHSYYKQNSERKEREYDRE